MLTLAGGVVAVAAVATRGEITLLQKSPEAVRIRFHSAISGPGCRCYSARIRTASDGGPAA